MHEIHVFVGSGIMGSSSSNHVPVSPRGRPAVSEDEAWDIALAWRDQLRGCVRLQATTERLPPTIIPTFDCVKFVFNGLEYDGFLKVKYPMVTAAYARAATIAWFALSCCEGYSGVENPQFWKRVFDELLYPKDIREAAASSGSAPIQMPITDAVRFFADADRPFPRIKLAVGEHSEDATIESVFFGRLTVEDEARDTQLQCILAKLQPFMRGSKQMRPVPVDLELLLPWKAVMRRRDTPKGNETELEAGVSMEFPQLFLQSVMLSKASLSSTQGLLKLFPPSAVEVCVREEDLTRDFLDLLQANFLTQDRRRWRVRYIGLTQTEDFSYSYLGLLCSALPHLQGVPCVSMPWHRYPKQIPTTIAADWAWLGYAIFHPDAGSLSGFTSLEADLTGITSVDVAHLAKMAVGNNLTGGSNSGYREGRVRCGTEVKMSPVDDDKASLYTFAAETWVTLCVPACRTKQYQDWVYVVVDGFGPGWIRDDNILETRNRAPGQSCIRVLGVNGCRQNDGSEEALLGLLGVLGDRLTSLHFRYGKELSASTIQSALRLCPSLKSLRVTHDGSFWSDEANTMELPRLEELELSVETSMGHPLRLRELKPACLRHLKALRVVASEAESFKHHERILVSFLSEQHVLQYLHWSNVFPRYGAWKDIRAYRKNEATRNFLSRVPAQHQLSRSNPFRLDRRLAFLSVIQHERGQSGIGGLGTDVIPLIFQYATSYSLREIFINP